MPFVPVIEIIVASRTEKRNENTLITHTNTLSGKMTEKKEILGSDLRDDFNILKDQYSNKFNELSTEAIGRVKIIRNALEEIFQKLEDEK